MTKGALTAYLDVAQLVLYMFWVFFAGLIWYLVRENRREGYPLESDRGIIEGWLPVPEPKTYRLADGREVQAPGKGMSEPFNAERLQAQGGSAYAPTGDPMLAGVGPGTWVERHDAPELDAEGHPKIRPLALVEGFTVSARDPDPRGMTVYGGHGDAAGTVSDLWLDVPESQFRYLQIEVAADGGTRQVLCPMAFARVTRDGVHVHALLAPQFAAVPAPKSPDRITLLEEERIVAYYGGGLLYAEPARAEPLV
jgi:photosynthetic reaction center H subunit